MGLVQVDTPANLYLPPPSCHHGHSQSSEAELVSAFTNPSAFQNAAFLISTYQKGQENAWEGEAPCCSQRRPKHAEYRATASVLGKYVRNWNNPWKSWALKASITQVSITVSKMPLDYFMGMTECRHCLYTFEPRSSLVQKMIAVAWVMGAASCEWPQKCKKKSLPLEEQIWMSACCWCKWNKSLSKSPPQRKKSIIESKWR